MSELNGLPPGFGEVDPDFQREAYAEAKKDRSETRNKGGQVTFLKSGVTRCRILPPHVSAPSWFYEYKEHGLRPDGKFRTYTCPSFFNNPCPICEEGTRLWNDKSDDRESSIAKAKSLNAKRAFLYNAYVYSNSDGRGLKNGMTVLKSGVTVFKKLMDVDNDASEWGDISNLKNGVDFKIERKGSGRYDTEYEVLPSPRRTNILELLAAEGLEISEPVDLSTVYPADAYDVLSVALSTHQYEKEEE